MENQFINKLSSFWKHSRAFRELAVVFVLAVTALWLVIAVEVQDQMAVRPHPSIWHQWQVDHLLVVLGLLVIGFAVFTWRRWQELESLVAERRQTEASLHQRTNLLQLQQVIAVAANEASSIEEAMQAGVNLICAYTGWPVGRAWLVAQNPARELVATDIWYLDNPERFAPFRQASMAGQVAPADSLSQRALTQAEPVWQAAAARDHQEPKPQTATVADLQTALAFPVWAGKEVVGVMEFFTNRIEPPSDRLSSVLSYVGTQLGRVIERQRAEQALRSREQYSRSLIENISDNIAVLEADGTMRYASPSVERIQGFKPEELAGRNAFDFVHPDDRARVQEVFRRNLDRPGHIEQLEFRVRHKDGSWRTLESVGKNLLADEAVRGIIINSRDITERQLTVEALRDSRSRLQEALEELQRTQQQIIQQERLRALGQMASGIAHDFNNALAPILGYTELLRHHPSLRQDQTKLTQFLDIMHTAAHDATSVVSRLREFYRNREDRDVFGPVDLNYLVRQTISLTQPKWKDQALAKGVNVRVEIDLHPVPVFSGNEANLRELLTNLIFNAVDSMPQGGAITVATGHNHRGVHLEVRDTGTGMTEEVRQRCLDPFFTTKGKLGTGLGLSIVHGIVRRHEGDIEIQTQLGQGTTFRIALPIQPVRPRGDEPSRPAPLPSRPLKVLIIDDEPTVREIEGEYLRADGHHVVTAATGLEGLSAFRAGHFDAVVLDRAMPGMSGDQVADAIKLLAPRTPVILLTGFGDMMKATGEKPAGVDVILNKPTSLDALRQTITALVAGQPLPLRPDTR